jgi:hypothetical protein
MLLVAHTHADMHAYIELVLPDGPLRNCDGEEEHESSDDDIARQQIGGSHCCCSDPTAKQAKNN